MQCLEIKELVQEQEQTEDYGVLPKAFSNSGNPVMNNKVVSVVKDIQASILFSELLMKNIFYSNTGQLDENGYFFYTIKDMENKFYIGRTAQNRILGILEKHNLIYREQKINKHNVAGRYFKVNFNHNIIEEIKLEYAEEQAPEEQEEEVVTEENIKPALDLLGNPISSYQKKKSGKLNRISPDVKRIARTVITYLNNKTSKNYKSDSPYNIKLIENLLKQGYTEYDIYAVTYEKYIDWYPVKEMKKYLRPSTLYGNGKFDKYHTEVTQEAISRARFMYINQISTREGRVKEFVRLLTDDDHRPPDYTWMDMYSREEVQEAKNKADELDPYSDIIF